jgi:hypothetical protein
VADQEHGPVVYGRQASQVAPDQPESARSDDPVRTAAELAQGRARLKVAKQPPNKVMLSTRTVPGMDGFKSTILNPNKSPKLPMEGRYDLNGVKTTRRKPTQDREAKRLVSGLRATSQQMGLLVFNDV